VLADVNVSLPLGSTDRELIRLLRDPWKAEVVIRLCASGSIESIETMEDVVERTGETMLSLPPQETM
jgi:Holliday junction resolvase